MRVLLHRDVLYVDAMIHNMHHDQHLLRMPVFQAVRGNKHWFCIIRTYTTWDHGFGVIDDAGELSLAGFKCGFCPMLIPITEVCRCICGWVLCNY